MDVKNALSLVSGPREAANHDELFMQQSLLFSDTLKDLKNLRNQLYSAAEYFEASYKKRQQKELVLETLKDYTIKAFVSTVDHLGSVAYKVNGLFDEKIDEASALELHLSCLEKICQHYINQRGKSQHSLAIQYPKHHKRYIFPVGEQTDGSNITESYNHRRDLVAESNFKNAVVRTIKGTPYQLFRGHSTSQSLQFLARQGSFSFSRTSINRQTEKRTVSPQRFPLIRSGSFKGSIPPNYETEKARYPSEPRRAVSLARHPQRDKATDMELYAGKSKRLFKALISMRKPRNDSSLYKFLDEA